MSFLERVHTETTQDPPHEVLWRQQCARNVMDCYALAMECLARSPGEPDLEALTRLMVDGMTSVRDAEDERIFYRMAAQLCRRCQKTLGGNGGFFRIYAAIFEDLAGEEDGK